jgi:hypothetical protein
LEVKQGSALISSMVGDHIRTERDVVHPFAFFFLRVLLALAARMYVLVPRRPKEEILPPKQNLKPFAIRSPNWELFAHGPLASSRQPTPPRAALALWAPWPTLRYPWLTAVTRPSQPLLRRTWQLARQSANGAQRE